MKRKVICPAPDTYVVTLPLSWANKHKIKKGDEIEMTESTDKLTISSGSPIVSKSIIIDISLLKDRVVRWYLSALHKSGYDQVEIKYNGAAQQRLVYELMKNLFTGFNVISETQNCLVLKSIANENKDEFDNALRRAFRVTLQMGEELVTAVSNGNINNSETINMIKEKELINNQLTNFCQRLINKYNYGGDKSVFLYAIVWNLEKVCDNYKYMVGAIEMSVNSKSDKPASGKQCTIKLSHDLISIMHDVNKYIENYYDLFYKFNITLLNDISQKKTSIAEAISRFKPSNDLEKELLAHMMVFVTQTTDFSASMIAYNNP